MSVLRAAADPTAALLALREFRPDGTYKPLMFLGDGEDCDIVRNAAAMLTIIADVMQDRPNGDINPEILRHAIEGVADALYLRAFAESAHSIHRMAK